MALVGSRAMWSVVDSSVPQFFFSVTPESAPPPLGPAGTNSSGTGKASVIVDFGDGVVALSDTFDHGSGAALNPLDNVMIFWRLYDV